VIDWFWSTVLYGSSLVVLAGLVGVPWPSKWLHRKSRRRALIMAAAGLAGVFTSRAVTPGTQSSITTHAIDEYAPTFQFREFHSTVVQAPPERVFAAVKSVSASEIALFQAFTWIRRGGQAGPESLLNPPPTKPILDVATDTGFMLLRELPPREVVIGAVLVAPPGTQRPGTFTPDDYKRITRPGFAMATMNFRIEPAGAASRLSTETRVFATDRETVGLFTPYWRMIFPGSAILRVTWLRAIKARAEQSGA
jgi:hypothetical protein